MANEDTPTALYDPAGDSDGSSVPLSAEGLHPQTQFGDYDLIEEIARGGMGVVFKARQRRLNRVVALKMILSGRFASEDEVRRFRIEAESAANLDHPGIVPIYEVGEHEGHHFFSMKFIGGGSLTDRLAELREDPHESARLIAQVARAIHHAHQRGVLHRDLKPGNLLLNEEGEPLVSDLGLAKQTHADSSLTQTGMVVGTPAYMAPEQAEGRREITTAADIYSLGAILYECLTGRPPNQGKTPIEALRHAIDSDITRPRSLDGRIDRTLEAICLRCLDRDPDRRYASAAGLADDLERWLRGESVSVRPPSLGSAVVEALQANLRSAAGAAAIGALAGVAFAFGMSRLYSDEDLREHPPEAIYDALPAPVPLGRSLAFVNELGRDGQPILLATLGVLAVIVFTGILVARATRAKPGGEAFSYGLIAAVFMAIAMFTVSLGFSVIADTHNSTRAVIAQLAEVSFGAPDEAEQAKQQLYSEFPGLESLPSEQRATTLAYRAYYDAIYDVPINMLIGVIMSSALCLTPCVAGTTFASKLLAERTKLWRWAPAYFEFMTVATALTILLFAATLIMIGEVDDPDSAINALMGTALVAGLLVALLTALYRRWLTWRGRLLVYGLPLAGLFLTSLF